ncbi:protein STPG4-like isoform X2 [Xenia sp. Carnegie-2017]|uniref:protein STPG4-like isoform X2 n=1 Tax=Xenia sp. Carnegie-2017 TaxID=2897299 RepID=UPI001F03BFBB|nr:protein STPG4-like isoform X2 [Xenia sp. Carnegie-2017]
MANVTVRISRNRSKHSQTPLSTAKSANDGRHSRRSEFGDNISDRGEWWRVTLKDTPNPGTYEVVDFINELNKKVVPQSYTFKDQGRQKNVDPSRKGSVLMPGQYKYQTFVDDLKNKQCHASFKGPKRFRGPGISGLIDKDLFQSDVSPFSYDKEYNIDKKHASKYAIFRSKVSRFPTVYFKPAQHQESMKLRSQGVLLRQSHLHSSQEHLVFRKFIT